MAAMLSRHCSWRCCRANFRALVTLSNLMHSSASSASEKPVVNAAIAIVVRDGRVLVAQRKADDTLGGLWEFPGGQWEDGETLEQCLHRELREELDIAAMPLRQLDVIEHDYP